MPLLQIRPVANRGVLLDDERGFQHCTHICFRQDHRCHIALNSSNVSMAECVYYTCRSRLPDLPVAVVVPVDARAGRPADEPRELDAQLVRVPQRLLSGGGDLVPCSNLQAQRLDSNMCSNIEGPSTYYGSVDKMICSGEEISRCMPDDDGALNGTSNLCCRRTSGSRRAGSEYATSLNFDVHKCGE